MAELTTPGTPSGTTTGTTGAATGTTPRTTGAATGTTAGPVTGAAPATAAVRAAEAGTETAGGPGAAAVGFLYPGYSAEDDYPRLEAMLAGAGPGDGGDMEPGSAATGGSGAGDGALGLAGAVTGASPAVRLPLVHTDIGEDAHRVDALLEMGSAARLAARVDELRARGAQAVVWACTSASFVFGREGAQEQVRELAQVAGLPASSTSFAFAHAIGDLGVEQVAVAATYPEDVAELFTAFLKSFGTEVVAMRGSGIITAAEVGTWGWEEVRALARAGDHPEAQAVLLPDTALHTAAYIARLEAELGKPVLTANQVTVREGLRLLAHPVPHRPRLGALFSAAAAAA